MTNTENSGNKLVQLPFSILREANMKRIPTFKNKKGELCHNSDGSDWSPAQWLQAVLGELGEYANFRKKFERGDISEKEFKIEASKELADVVTYLDILSYRLGIDLGKAVYNKFNEISSRIGSPIFIIEYHFIENEQRVAYYSVEKVEEPGIKKSSF